MSKRIQTVVAIVLVVCVLLPATAYPLMYAPDSRRDIVLDGHGEPPVEANVHYSVQPRDKAVSVYYYVVLSPWMSVMFSRNSFLLNWY